MLAASSLVALAVAMVVPFTPIGGWFGFEAPPAPMLAGIAVVVVLYLVCAELLKPLAVKETPDGLLSPMTVPLIGVDEHIVMLA